MNAPTVRSRAQGALVGLTVGDAIGRPAEGLTVEQIRSQWGRIDGFVVDEPEGSDDTEFALYTALLLLELRERFTADHIANAWLRDVCRQEGAFRGSGFSEMSAIRNLLAGMKPPYSGLHSHSFSDGLAMRVAPLGIAAIGDPGSAVRLAAEDGKVSHSGEGIYSGQFVAAVIAAGVAGADLMTSLREGLALIPSGWSSRAIERAIEIGLSSRTETELIEAMHQQLVQRRYFWADLAPEAVAIAVAALTFSEGNLQQSILVCVNTGRDADTTAAIAGAIAGAIGGVESVPADWVTVVGPLGGTCLRVARGLHPIEMANRLVEEVWS